MRAGRAQLQEAYVYLPRRRGVPHRRAPLTLPTASTHVDADPVRTRKLLLRPQRVAGTDRRGGGTARLHPGAAGAVLEERPPQSAGRARQGQEAARQARVWKRSATGKRDKARLCDAAEKTRAEAPRWYAADVKSEGGRPVSTRVANLQGRTEVQCPRNPAANHSCQRRQLRSSCLTRS